MSKIKTTEASVPKHLEDIPNYDNNDQVMIQKCLRIPIVYLEYLDSKFPDQKFSELVRTAIFNQYIR